LIRVKAGPAFSRLGWRQTKQEKESAMSNTPHELAEEFPAEVQKMHDLKLSDAHFARLFDSYHDVNRAVHRAETRVEPISEEAEQELRRKRAALKDEIARMLAQ